MFKNSDISHLTEEQQIAVKVLDRPMALIAGAGSGKTSVLVLRYLALLKKGLRPHQILSVTFTNEAAEEMRSRIIALLERGESDPKLILEVQNAVYLGTLHGFCYQLLSEYGSAIGVADLKGIVNPFRLADAFNQSYRAWINAVPPTDLTRLMQSYSHQELRELLRELYLHHKSLEASPKHGEVLTFLLEQARPLFQSLDGKFHSQGYFTFDDLEHFALKILKDSPTALAKLQGNFQAVLVDEFQDTSRMQWDILHHIIGNDWSRLFVVGDPKQSIYAFRHAEVKLFNEIAEGIRRREGLVVELTHNFRTHENLLDQVNQLSEVLFDGAEVPFFEMKSGRTEKTEKSLEVIRYASSPEAKRKDLQRAELEAVAAHVTRLRDSGVKSSEIALLFRMGDRMPEYAEALRARGFSVRAKQILSLYQSYDILDLTAFLKCIANPLDDFAVSGFLASRYVGYSFQQFWSLFQKPGKSLFEKLTSEPVPSLKWLVDLIESGEVRVDTCLSVLFRETQYWPAHQEALLALFEPLSENGLTVYEALSQMEAWEKEDILFETVSGNGLEDSVTLLTVHGAKGLEFNHVLLVDNLRQFPRKSPLVLLKPGEPTGLRYRDGEEWAETKPYEALKQGQFKTDTEEARRILYVALTRAKESLSLFIPEDAEGAPKGSWAQLLNGALEVQK